ncbi:MAG: DNA-binding response regulator [Anaerolineae bacterium]|nr:DNA-binding response regulator [Anaerolineae bacterium]MDK1080000.1 DNA-binding response regulator [Anaerolineae bacterium]MDK1117227.1 DNA-binding response regulator [Anaerolineae bacterium]
MSKNKDIRVLIVEDDPSWQNLLSELVADLGFQVDVASDLSQAEELIRNSSHRLAIVDLSLNISDHKNSDGFNILDKIRLYDPGCSSLLLSGYATVELAVKAIKDYGAYTCLHKENFSRSGFKDTVQEMLAQPNARQVNYSRFESDKTTIASAETRTQNISGDKKALIVEDDAGWMDLLSELLLESGYSIQVSRSFGEAFGFLGRIKYQLAVIDLSLDRRFQNVDPKDYEGFRLLDNCNVKGITTIVVSGVGSPEVIEQLYDKYRIFAYLEKQTFERSAFLQSVGLAYDLKQVNGELKNLTERELQVLSLLTQGLINKEIAKQLIISPNTIKRHIKAIYQKLNVHTRSAATAKAIKAGITGER